jgi:hypothetical protein
MEAKVNVFEKVALEARKLLATKTCKVPLEAWQKAVASCIPHSEYMQRKSCPKNTFLALCEEGLITGIDKGNYTKTETVEKFYALNALQIIKNDPKVLKDSLKKLWTRACNDTKKKHDSQMNIVRVLCIHNLITINNLDT